MKVCYKMNKAKRLYTDYPVVKCVCLPSLDSIKELAISSTKWWHSLFCTLQRLTIQRSTERKESLCEALQVGANSRNRESTAFNLSSRSTLAGSSFKLTDSIKYITSTLRQNRRSPCTFLSQNPTSLFSRSTAAILFFKLIFY